MQQRRMLQVPKADAAVAASPTPPLVGMVNFAKGSSNKKPSDVTKAAIVDNSNNVPTSTSGDSMMTENGTNSREENFVIRPDDIDDKLYSSESDLVERPDAAAAVAAATTSLLRANDHKAKIQKQLTKPTSVGNFLKLQSDTDTKDDDDPYNDLSGPEKDI